MPLASQHEIVSFGTFEVDLEAGEIRKSGLRVRLTGQPYRLLLALLARPGETISREELQLEIWGANTNVDFERGIASAVNKLREALGDSADHPVYIETLSRKGYRFIAPVTRTALGARESGQNSSEDDRPAATPAEAVPEAGSPSTTFLNVTGQSLAAGPRTSTAPKSSNQRVTLAFIGVAIVLLAGSARWLWPRSPVLAPPHIEQLTETNDIYPGPPSPETLLSIVTDGPRLYVPALVKGRSQLSSLAFNGSFRQPVALPATLSTGAVTDISADGSRLLVRSVTNREPEQPLWVVPVTGAGARRIGDVLAHDAAWMPKSRDTVVFASGSELRLVDLNTGAVSPYLSLPGRPFWLRWSPDGRTLRFTLLDPATHSTQIWEMEADQRRAQPLAFPEMKGQNICCGSWIPSTSKPSGGGFVFQASDDHGTNLWMASPGTHPTLTQLTNGPIRFSSPLPSRDGTAIFAFGASASEAVERYDLHRHDLVPAEFYLRDAERVSYSRDGVWVAWTDSRGRLWRARTHDGEDLLQLTSDEIEVFSAEWSPDGHRLALMARQRSGPWQLYSVDAAGGALSSLVNDSRNLADPSWSADGKQIVFGREADLMGEESGVHNIAILDLGTHATRSLPASEDVFSPRWSPDGHWIAALSRDQSRLLLFDLSKGTWTTLFTGGAADPVWSADSRSVLFHAFATDRAAILQAGVSGSLQTLINLSDLGKALSDSCFFSGVAPDGSPLIKPQIGTGNLYSVTLPQLH